MTPSIHHESIKKLIARLIEAWATETQTPLNSYGSWTVLSEAQRRGVEPDECYVLGRKPKRVPDIVLEVIWTAGGLDKLAVYRGLGVREVWLWREGKIEMYSLSRRGAEAKTQSKLLPGLDLTLVARYAQATDHTQAVLDFLAAMRGN
jgi:Uma2 family endonuclease